MNVKIHPEWQKVLQPEFEKEYFKQLADFVRTEYQSGVIYPPASAIFNAFNLCSFNNIKVVLIGQDPYHGPGQAHGLCFSVSDGVKFPPSLQNIFKEIQNDLDIPFPISGNLERWAKQGILLLNATLTVRANQAGSHQNKGWETFTDAVIEAISQQLNQVVFILWGRYAKEKGKMIDRNKHFILEAAHPSPFSAYNGFMGCKHFSQTNLILESIGQKPIDW